ncbi:malectin [Rhodopirellula baltica]|nr:malectin [Rhodopirellula baltica]
MKPSCLCLCIILIATPAIRGQDIPLNVAEQPDTQDKSQLTGLDTDKELDSTATLDEFLVNSEHWGMRSFAQDVADGDYLVNLYFAETFPRITGPGQRVFSFRVNGIEFDEFDIWQKAGGSNRVYVESVPVKINSGILWVTFSSEMDYPRSRRLKSFHKKKRHPSKRSSESTQAGKQLRLTRPDGNGWRIKVSWAVGPFQETDSLATVVSAGLPLNRRWYS